MVDQLVADKGYKISRVNEGLDKINTIMSLADLVITPDTGLGHYGSALGKPSIMFSLGDPVRWSTTMTKRVMHEKAIESYKLGRGTYEKAWGSDKNEYYVEDDGKKVGASDIDPQRILNKVDDVLSPRD